MSSGVFDLLKFIDGLGQERKKQILNEDSFEYALLNAVDVCVDPESLFQVFVEMFHSGHSYFYSVEGQVCKESIESIYLANVIISVTKACPNQEIRLKWLAPFVNLFKIGCELPWECVTTSCKRKPQIFLAASLMAVMRTIHEGVSLNPGQSSTDLEAEFTCNLTSFLALQNRNLCLLPSTGTAYYFQDLDECCCDYTYLEQSVEIWLKNSPSYWLSSDKSSVEANAIVSTLNCLYEECPSFVFREAAMIIILKVITVRESSLPIWVRAKNLQP